MNEADWINICQSDELVCNSGVCVLVQGKQIAIFKIRSGEQERIYATSNWDPIGNANVIYRGLLGCANDEPVVASPLYKQRFSLITGQCLENQAMQIQVYPARIHQNNLQLSV